MIHYVYIYLDTRKPGNFIYDDMLFNFEPFYVGQGKNNRCYEGLKYGGSLYKKRKIQKIIKDGYKPEVIILHKNLEFEMAIKLEIEIILKIGRKDLNKGPLVNLTDGGEGTLNMSIESQEKKSKKLKGRKHTEETKEKIKLSRKTYFDAGNTTWNKGKPWSDEMKRKLTNKSNTGKKFSKTHKDKMSNNAKNQILEGRSIIKLRPILQYTMNDEFIKEYESIISASLETNIRNNAISNCCAKISKSSGGFKWYYKNNKEL